MTKQHGGPAIRKRGTGLRVQVYAGRDPLTGRKRQKIGTAATKAEAHRPEARLIREDGANPLRWRRPLRGDRGTGGHRETRVPSRVDEDLHVLFLVVDKLAKPAVHQVVELDAPGDELAGVDLALAE
jgi:hypothetical protein